MSYTVYIQSEQVNESIAHPSLTNIILYIQEQQSQIERLQDMEQHRKRPRASRHLRLQDKWIELDGFKEFLKKLRLEHDGF